MGKAWWACILVAAGLSGLGLILAHTPGVEASDVRLLAYGSGVFMGLSFRFVPSLFREG